MMRKLIILLAMGLLLLASVASVSAEEKVTKSDVTIDAFDDKSEIIPFTSSGDKVNVDVTSDINVDVYIIASDDYSYSSNDYSNAKVSKTGTKDTSFSYKIPDTQSYYLVIYNPNNETATVSYEYTNLWYENVEEASEEAFRWLGLGILLCVGVVVIIIVVIIVIIVLLTRKKDDQPQQQYPPGYQYPQGQYPPPPGHPPYPPTGGQQPPQQPR